MPRDWKNDPVAVERHCTCRKQMWIDDDDTTQWYILRDDPACPLHGNRPEHNLPEVFP